MIGVHTPEFGFEQNLENVVAQSRNLGVEYPIAVDSDYAVWGAFANHFWPAVYIADEEGRIRFHHFGEGEYPMTEMVIQQLLRDTGADGIDQELVTVEPRGLEVAADWQTLQSPETYVGYSQSTGFAQERVAGFDEARATRGRNGCASMSGRLSGNWTVAGHAAVSERAGRKSRLPVPRARCQPRDGPVIPRSVDPVPGVPRRPARHRCARDRRGHGWQRGRQRPAHLPADPPTGRRSPTASSRSSSPTRGVEAYCFTFG